MKPPLWLGSLLYIAGWPLIWLGLRGSRRAYIILVCDNDVLLTKNWLGYKRKWRLPGGGLHHKELPLQGALRELKEELGIIIDSKMCNLLIDNLKATEINYNFWAYECLLPSKPILKPSFDTIIYQWVPINNLKDQVISEELKTALPLVKTNSILV